LTAYTYDANGNMVAGDGRTVAFDNLDRPTTVTLVGTTPPTNFGYAPDGSRYAQTGPAGTEYYVDKLYEYIVKSTGATEERTHISDAVEVVRSSGTRSLRYRDLDRLGSLETATTETGSEDLAYSHGYDAFGKPRSRDWQYSGDKMNQSFEHGFTGHEHLDDLYLIHMNGRLYDYRLGRFLSVDPIISNPANSQSINPYSYIGNNPLSGTDPTGYECQGGGGMTAPGQAPSTGSHICGSKPENSSSSISVNGNPAVSGSNMFKEAVRTFLAHNGAAPDDRPRASSDKNSPSDANAKPEPTIKDLRDWMRKNYPEFTNTLDREWSAYQKGGVPSWGSNAGPQFAGIGPLSALKLKLLLEEMIKGGGKAFAGYDTPSVFRDAAKIAEAQPELGPAEMLQKVTTEAAHVEELGNVSVHGVRNAATGAQGDFKLVIDRLQGPAEKIGAKIAEKLPGAMESLSQFLLSNMGTMSSFVVVPNTGMLERQIKGSTPGTCTTPQCGL